MGGRVLPFKKTSSRTHTVANDFKTLRGTCCCGSMPPNEGHILLNSRCILRTNHFAFTLPAAAGRILPGLADTLSLWHLLDERLTAHISTNGLTDQVIAHTGSCLESRARWLHGFSRPMHDGSAGYELCADPGEDDLDV